MGEIRGRDRVGGMKVAQLRQRICRIFDRHHARGSDEERAARAKPACTTLFSRPQLSGLDITSLAGDRSGPPSSPKKEVAGGRCRNFWPGRKRSVSSIKPRRRRRRRTRDGLQPARSRRGRYHECSSRQEASSDGNKCCRSLASFVVARPQMGRSRRARARRQPVAIAYRQMRGLPLGGRTRPTS